MRTTIISVLTVVAGVLVAAHGAAAATTTTPSAATYGGQTKTVPAAFAAKVAAVCQNTSMVLTAAAKSACASGSFPRVTAAATAFVNIGTGAELNTLMRQLPAAITASK